MMTRQLYRYAFKPDVPLDDIEAALVLAVLGAEALHVESQVRLDAGHYLDRERHACIIDAGTDVGKDLNRLFIIFLRQELGEDAFDVEHVDEPPSRQTQEASA